MHKLALQHQLHCLIQINLALITIPQISEIIRVDTQSLAKKHLIKKVNTKTLCLMLRLILQILDSKDYQVSLIIEAAKQATLINISSN